jgi:hypothetical protein
MRVGLARLCVVGGANWATDVAVEVGGLLGVDVVDVEASGVEVVVGLVVEDVVDVDVVVVVVVVDVVVDVVDVDVVVVVVAVVPEQMWDNTNFGLPVDGEIKAEEPSWRTSSAVRPAGTCTNTLSAWPLLRTRSPPEKTNSVPSRSSVISTKENWSSLGAMTKCQ